MRVIALGVLVIAFGLVVAPSALAHDDVIGTSPKNGDQRTSAPAEVRIQFSAEASPQSGEGSITGPEGNSVQSGPAKVEGSALVIPMRPTTAVGRYAVDFRTVSSDRHPVAGSITFELVEPTSPSSTPAPSKAAPNPTTDAADETPIWPWAFVAAVVGIGAVALLRTVSRSKND